METYQAQKLGTDTRVCAAKNADLHEHELILETHH